MPKRRDGVNENEVHLHQAELDAEGSIPEGAVRIEDEAARRELLELSIAVAGIGTFDWDLVAGTLVWDDRLIELFGYEPGTFDQTIGGFNSRLHPDDLPRVTTDLQAAIKECGDFESEYRIVLPGDEIRWIGARGRALCDEHGTAVRMLGAAWDVTSRAEHEARITRGLESMSTAFFSLDTSWRFTYANPEAERVLGRTRAELLGGVIWELFPGALSSDFETQYRHVMETGDPVAFDAFYPEPLNSWYEVRAWRNADGIAVYFLDVTARHRAQELAERAAQRAHLLAQITEQLAGTLDSEEASVRLTHLLVPALAEWAIVTLAADDSQPGSRHGLRHACARHADPVMQPVVEEYAKQRLAAMTDDEIIVRAMEANESQFILSGATARTSELLTPGPVRDMLVSLAPESVVVLPLNGRNGPVGMLTLANGGARGKFSPEDLLTAHHVAARAGLVLDNARLYRQQREIAEGLQRSLLTAPVEPDHVQVVVRYVPAAEAAQVGGDWYDAFIQPGGATMLVIGDVIGHNAEAASAMGQVRSIVRTLGAVGNESPAGVLRKSDQVMETLQTNTTASAIVARLEQDQSELKRAITRLRWSNAGHPPPMAIHADGQVLPLNDVSSDMLLGVMPGVDRRESEVVLDRHAVVLMYTDGLVERRGQSIEDGLELLRRSLEELAGLELGELCDELLARMLPPNSDDDVAIVAVKLHPQNEPRPAEAGPRNIPPNVPDSPEVVKQTT